MVHHHGIPSLVRQFSSSKNTILGNINWNSETSLNPLGPRPAAALSLQNPLWREVTVLYDPGIQLQKVIINTKHKFQLTSYFSQFANTVFLYIQQV